MEKIETSTPDITEENIEKIIELFPQVATEVETSKGELERAIDFDALRELLGDVAEGERERYQFTWPGKREAKAEARRPINKTMIPCPEKSVDWDTTENLYIEGDNLDALKLLKETYAGKIKLIYIDPPYNTGNDFIYKDNYAISADKYESGETTEEGRLVANLESNGRFHSEWCSMMYPRLLLARDLLTSDGVIFISIDSHEKANMEKICDEIFGHDNLKNTIAVRRGIKNVQAQFDDVAALSQGHEYILVYSKMVGTRFKKLELVHDGKPGKWDTFWRGTDRPTMRYTLFGETPESGQWRWAEDRSREAIENYEKYLKINASTGIGIDEYYLDHLTATNEKLNFLRQNEEGVIQYYVPPSNGKLLSDNWMDITLSGNTTEEFDTEKSAALLKRIVSWVAQPEDTVLDFFSGSGTTGQAVMEEAIESGIDLKYILVQLPIELTNSTRTICDVAEKRIRDCGQTIIDQHRETLFENTNSDTGFRVLRIDSSNFKDTFMTPGQVTQTSVLDAIDNVKEGRTAEDILFQVLPAFRIPYSAHIDTLDIHGKKVFDVNHGQLLACFDADVTNDVIEEIARRKPSYAVMRDLSFRNDSASANFEELFKTFSPDTIRRVI